MPSLDFALIGHQDSWSRLESVVRALRDSRREALDESVIREIVPWIPPRVVRRLTVHSQVPNRCAHGVYIDTFITPEDLTAASPLRLLGRTEEAIRCAEREGAGIASLGGFTSIVLEGAGPRIQARDSSLVLTTGNTLTAAYIVKGVERAATIRGLDLAASHVMVIGATGDVGSGCVRYLAKRVRALSLVARNESRLRRLGDEVGRPGLVVDCAVDPAALLPKADVIVAAAALAVPTFRLDSCRAGALVCDAGYPKNLVPETSSDVDLFWGGMGQALAGWRIDGADDGFYAFPAPFVAHGCMLEGIALALEGRVEPFSAGRGRITEPRIEEMWTIAQRHGLALAPFFNGAGLQSAS